MPHHADVRTQPSFAAAVGRAVVDEDDFVSRGRIVANRFDRPPHFVPLVKGSDYDGQHNGSLGPIERRLRMMLRQIGLALRTGANLFLRAQIAAHRALSLADAVVIGGVTLHLAAGVFPS